MDVVRGPPGSFVAGGTDCGVHEVSSGIPMKRINEKKGALTTLEAEKVREESLLIF